MSFLMPGQLLASLLEQVLNKALTMSLNGKQALAGLEGKSLTLNISELATPLTLVVSGGAIFVLTDEQHSDCRIDSSFKTLRALQQQQSLTELIRQQQLDLIGEHKVAQGFAQIAETLEIDWQSALAAQIGDVATHKLLRLGSSFQGKLRFAAEQIRADSSEWLLHEKKLALTHAEANDFSAKVQQAQQQTRQLEQRLARLQLKNSSQG